MLMTWHHLQTLHFSLNKDYLLFLFQQGNLNGAFFIRNPFYELYKRVGSTDDRLKAKQCHMSSHLAVDNDTTTFLFLVSNS